MTEMDQVVNFIILTIWYPASHSIKKFPFYLQKMIQFNSNDYFILYANCIATKGFGRSIVSDLQRAEYHYIPNDLFEILELTKTKTLSEIYSLYSEDNQDILNEYFDFLIKKNLGFIDDERNVFPDLSLEWDAPSVITNSIIDVDDAYIDELNYDKVFQDLSSLNCSCVQIRGFDSISNEKIQSLLAATLNTRIKEIRLVLKYSAATNEFVINTLIPNHKRISQVIFFNHPDYKEEYVVGVRVSYLAIPKLTKNDCGEICVSSFSVNTQHYTESLRFNSCLNRKISVDSQGFIKNCPSQESNFGHIKTDDLREVVKDSQFQRLWKVKKDDIKICKDCEHRYICTDCRIFRQDKHDQFSKPLKCSYDPYTTTWN
jgi:SPASM domain peptide maturase of grasp-with-spasm system